MSPIKDPKVELVIVMFIVPLVVNVSEMSVSYVYLSVYLCYFKVMEV